MAQEYRDQSTPATPHHAVRGFSDTFGLLPSIAVLTVVIDWMLFSAEGVTLGAFWPFSVIIGGAVGVITYRAQRRFFGDDKDAAQIKGLIVALLVAIPSPITSALFVPAGLLGFFSRRNKG